MRKNHTLLDTTIDDWYIEDFVYSYYHNDAQLPGFLEDVVMSVADLKAKYAAGEASINLCVSTIREVWGIAMDYVFTAPIDNQEQSLIKEMFDDCP